MSKFQWTNKSFLKLPFHAFSKTKAKDGDSDLGPKIETRRLYVEFALSLVQQAPTDFLNTVLSIKDFVGAILQVMSPLSHI